MMTTRKMMAGAALTAGLAALAGAFGPAPQTDETIDSVRESQRQYVELRSQISLEIQQREQTALFLEEQIELLQGRIERLKEDTEGLRGTIDETKESRAELEAKEGRLKDGMASLEASIEGLEAKAKQVLARVPAPVREQVIQISRNLMEEPEAPEEGEEPKALELYTRYIQVVGAMNMIDKFNTTLQRTTETIDIPGLSTPRNVTVFYLGAGQAYYVDKEGKYAGMGMPTEDGFEWVADNDLAETLALMNKMYDGGAEAAFLQVPVSNN